MKRIDYVNVKQGTENCRRFSHGNALPLIALPHGMAAFSLQTDGGSNWFYNPRRDYYEGIRLTHQPSPWNGDYGHLLFVPQSGDAAFSPDAFYSGMRRKETVLKPHYMAVRSLRYDCVTELVPTCRGAVLKIKYGDPERTRRLTILPFSADFSFTVDAAAGKLTGSAKAFNHSVHKDMALYIAVKFDCAVDAARCVLKQGNGGGVSVAFLADEVTARIGISFLSPAQAERNLEREVGGETFSALRLKAENIWEEILSRIAVEGSAERMRTFYSCLWRAFLFPTVFYEIDEKGDKIHICPDTAKIGKGVYYVNNGFWDTYRTVYPLYAVVAREEYAEMCEGFVNYYLDTGWLPRWLSPGEYGIMPGTLIEAVLSDAIVKGVIGGDLAKTALAAMCKQANTPSGTPARGRAACAEYNALGYVPCDLFGESVNATLDYAYCDFCIAQAAEKLGERKTAAAFYARSKNYKNLFDAESGFLRGKDSAGKMRAQFDPFAWGGDYCEGGAWQNGFGVYHDVEGLASLYGGRANLIGKLDALFAEKPRYRAGGYGGEIHEMTEMGVRDFGQCAVSNQPSFHLPYLFAMLGEREKTEYWAEKIADEAFSWEETGFPGDEDNGSMAAWYVFTAMGFYPVCPGKDEYIAAKPLFESVAVCGRKLPPRFEKGAVSVKDILGK